MSEKEIRTYLLIFFVGGVSFVIMHKLSDKL